ncbi:uncharacterized protein LOC114526281 [Dendronephthya gigantea]|uniref:uncharacterized protein LOC114526281 n=1 Tax=Dendronephthya gigantea TaxID=151771 RepID=UPI00106B2528|nr:uncharacterized protein LOC114526281 [Dendronephthya gigantea]
MQSSFSPNFHMNATLVRKKILDREFCTKISASPDTQENILWQKGSYCIYRKRYVCPDNMVKGSIQWDDEDDDVGNDRVEGVIPYFSISGHSSENTVLYYCCQIEGKWYNSIQLPTRKPFYLLPYGSRNCQRVVGAVSSLEYIVFDTEDTGNVDYFRGHHVFTNENKSTPIIFYCYYEGCQHKLQSDHGTFASSNFFNGAYPDFQFCSWSITVNGSLPISLKFQTIHVPDCNNNYLDIYDGQTANGSALLSRFCGENATSGTTLISITSQLYIVFKSGNNTVSGEKNSQKALGFYAVYESLLPTVSAKTSLSVSISKSFDGRGKYSKNSSSGKTVIYLSVILPIIATLAILGVLAVVFYRRRNLKLDDSPVGKENMQSGPTSKRCRTLDGHRVTSKSKLNPIYEPGADSLYGDDNEANETRNATDNILYESGNEKDCAVYESAGNEIFEANPIYQGIDGDGDVDLTYSEPNK